MLPGESIDPYYDIFDDWGLIVSSFLTQYGLRIQTKEFETVSWDEFYELLAGIAPETPLGRVVSLRSETYEKVLKQFSREQKRIHDEWQEKQAARMTPETYLKQMAELEHMLAAMCGGG